MEAVTDGRHLFFPQKDLNRQLPTHFTVIDIHYNSFCFVFVIIYTVETLLTRERGLCGPLAVSILIVSLQHISCRGSIGSFHYDRV